MYPSWGIKASPRRKGPTSKKKFRWEVLGLQDPSVTSSTPSIEDVRRQIISASNYGFSPNTLARSLEKNGQPPRRSKATADTRKRGAVSR